MPVAGRMFLSLPWTASPGPILANDVMPLLPAHLRPACLAGCALSVSV